MAQKLVCALLGLLGLAVDPAGAQSIGIFADEAATSCNITSGPYQTFYVVGVNTDQLPTGGFLGCSFRVDLDGASFSDGPFVSTTATVVHGSPVAGPKVTAGWPTCQVTGGMAVLFSITGTLQDSADKTFRVLGDLAPTHPVCFFSPVGDVYFTVCDDPVFTKICVPGGEAFVDSQRDCTVVVEAATWSEVKSLFEE